MIVEEAAYLEHFGIKGMKWGQRRQNRAGGKAPSKAKRNLAIVGAVAGSAALAAGAIGIKSVLGKRSQIKLAELTRDEHFKKLRDTGFAWAEKGGKWNYTLPGANLYPATKALMPNSLQKP